MVYSSLSTTAALIKAKESFELPDSELIILKQEQAKQDLKWCLCEILNTEVDSTVFQEFLDTNENFLQEVLAVRQLYWYFLENDKGEGSKNRELMKVYDKMYKELIQKLPSMKSLEIPVRTFKSILR